MNRIIAWTLWAIGHTYSKLMYRLRLPYAPYRYLMGKSSDIQGPSGNGPWEKIPPLSKDKITFGDFPVARLER